MPAAAATAAATIIGGAMAADAASDASSAQQASCREAIQAQQQASQMQHMLQMQSREDMRPWRETGEAALNRLAYMVGIGGLPTGRQQTEAEIRAELLPQFTRQAAAQASQGVPAPPPAPNQNATYTVDPQTGQWGWRYQEDQGEDGFATLFRSAEEPYFDQMTGQWYGQQGHRPENPYAIGPEHFSAGAHAGAGQSGPVVDEEGLSAAVQRRLAVQPAGAGQSGPVVDEEGLSAAVQRRLAEQQAALEAAQADPEYGSLLRSMTGEDYRNDAVRQELERLNLYGPFSLDKFQEDPGHQFRLEQGEQAINRAAAAAGRYDSGRALKDLTAYNSGLASQEYGNAFSRYYTDQGAISDIHNQAFDRDNITRGNSFNRLAQMAGFGQNAAGQMGTMGQAYGSMLGNNANAMSSLALQGGNAAAAGIVGQSNAWGNTLGGLANLAGDYFAKNNQNTNSPSRVTSYGLRWS